MMVLCCGDFFFLNPTEIGTIKKKCQDLYCKGVRAQRLTGLR